MFRLGKTAKSARILGCTSIRCFILAVSGSAVYYAGLRAYHSDGLPVALLVIVVPAAFALLTIIWHKSHPDHRVILPLVCLLAGPILLPPVYFALRPSQTPAAEDLNFWVKLGSLYTILPLLVVEIQLLPMGWALDLSASLSILASMWMGIGQRIGPSDASTH